MSAVLTSLTLCLVAISCRATVISDQGNNGTRPFDVQSVLFKTLCDCVTSDVSKETVLCLRERLSTVVEDLNVAREITIVPNYVALVKEKPLNGTVSDITAGKSRSLVDTVSTVFSNRRIQLRLPAFSTFIQSEGRGKKNDKGYAIVGMMMAGSMVAMGMAALAALAGKALAISMAALMMAAIAAMRKGHEGGGGHHHSSYEVVSVPVPGHRHRSLYHNNDVPISEPPVKPFAYENFPSEL